MFLKSAGSYENAKETERDVLTCDENGFAQTKDMPYGIYTVRLTSGSVIPRKQAMTSIWAYG